MTPFTLLQFLVFAGFLALLVPLRSVGLAIQQDHISYVSRHLFQPSAYLVYLLILACGAVVRGIFTVVPNGAAWAPLRTLRFHLLITTASILAAYCAIELSWGSDGVRFGLIGLAGGLACHLLAIPLGYRSPWCRSDVEVVNVPLVSQENVNSFLGMVGLLVLLAHLLMSPQGVLQTLKAMASELEAFWAGLPRT